MKQGICLFVLFLAAIPASGKERPDAAALAAEIDRLVNEKLKAEGVAPAPRADDATFFRHCTVNPAAADENAVMIAHHCQDLPTGIWQAYGITLLTNVSTPYESCPAPLLALRTVSYCAENEWTPPGGDTGMRWLILLPTGPGALFGGWVGEQFGLRATLSFSGAATLLLAFLAWCSRSFASCGRCPAWMRAWARAVMLGLC